MDLDAIQRKLIAAARTKALDEHVPYAFEKRILARVQDLPVLDQAALWSRALWRATAPCLGIMLLLVAWAAFAPASAPKHDLSQEFENTVLAVLTQEPTTESGW